jgi:glycosyltransferase involved in cell wall biosynthesis
MLNNDPNLARRAGYGGETIDDLIKEFKPDLYIGAEDIWAFNEFWDKKWWSKTNSMVWTTLDSEPILPLAQQAAPKIDNYFVWASFAEREMAKLGHSHVKTLRGAIDTDYFFKATDEYKLKLRKSFGISEDTFIIGFVFRNQLRKSVPNLLDGYSKFLKEHPKSNAKLLLHTHWNEGWDILRLLKEKNIDPSQILTTYYCPECQNYQVTSYRGENQNCPFCGSEKTFNTTSVKGGVSESQLNEVYNLMDVYCHPFTSGGQEIPVQEAKLCELITLVTNYSCGEDCCTEESGGLPLSWSEYREPGTQFIKASTNPNSISEQLSNVYDMSVEERKLTGVKARKFVLNNYSIDVIGPKLENIIDSMPDIKWDFDFTEEERDPDYIPKDIESTPEWLSDIYKNILKVDLDESDPGHKHWMTQISKGMSRDDVLKYFKKVAQKENQDMSNESIELHLGNEGQENRIAVIINGGPREAIFLNSFLENLQKLYSGDAIYVICDPKLNPLIEDNPYCHKTIPYDKTLDDGFVLEGKSEHEGLFKVALYPSHFANSHPYHFHNGLDRTFFDFK